ncbi:restriction endonuclease subunit S [Lactococcus cremoris]|uniref:restriction endonuclease subunit S n=1 Tax=Lactococcus lactis subsp. cremoris TaxID=1359 RepID=UPI003D9A12EF
MSKKSPQLRFEGFTDDWEERKFGEVWKKSSERNLNLEYSPKQVLSVAQMKLNPSNRNEQDDYMKTYNVLHKGDIAFEGNKSKSFAFGRFVLNDLQDGIVSHVFNVYRPICKMDTDFMKVYINNESVMKYLLVKATTKTLMMTTLNTKDIVKQKLNLPSLEEQQKIGSFFKQLDATIALHQRKLDLLKEQKKGYLQKMFPKNGAKVPELRFAGFADDWEERKLSGIIEKLSGGASIKPTDYLEDGIRTIPKGAVNATGIADLSGSKYISEDFFEKNITSHAHTSNLVTSLRDLVPSAPNMGRIVRIEGDDEQFLMPQGVYKLELFEGMDEDFLISFSNSDKYRKIISAEKNGSTQVHIRNGEFLNIDINLPSEHEQKKIGSFFKQLDNTIALHQRKLDLLKEQKKGFLQKMFV